MGYIDGLRELLPPGRVLADEPMSRHTTMRVGGPADCFAEVGSREELVSAVGFLRDQDVAFAVIGRGSNLIVGDGGFRGAVLCTAGAMSGMSDDGGVIRAEGGALLSAVAAYAAERSLTGLEFAAGIPGTVGGGIRMNAGAYGGELGDITCDVEVIGADGRVAVRTNADMGFGYRHSAAQGNGDIIISCRLRLEDGDREAIEGRMRELAASRREKQPLEYPSAGSTWRRPEGHFAAKLIEEAGCKGLSVGGARISDKHAGFLVNMGGARASDIRRLMDIVEQRVYAHSGVKLTPEVEFIG